MMTTKSEISLYTPINTENLHTHDTISVYTVLCTGACDSVGVTVIQCVCL